MKAYADIIEERERLKRELAEAKAMLGFHNRRGKSSEKKRKLNTEIQAKNNTEASKKCKASETTSKKTNNQLQMWWALRHHKQIRKKQTISFRCGGH